MRIFRLRIFLLFKCPFKLSKKCFFYNCLVITPWKCEYCLIWVLNKSILFGNNSLKVSLLCDMYSEKSFYYSLICKELSENVSIVWCLETCVALFGRNSIKCQYCLIWNLKKCFLLLEVIVWKCEYFSGGTPTSMCHFFRSSVCPSVRRTPNLRNHASCDHYFWYTCVKWWHLQTFFSFLKNFDFLSR